MADKKAFYSKGPETTIRYYDTTGKEHTVTLPERGKGKVEVSTEADSDYEKYLVLEAQLQAGLISENPPQTSTSTANDKGAK